MTEIGGNSYIGRILNKEFANKTEITSSDIYGLDKANDNKLDLDANHDGKIATQELKDYLKTEGYDTKFSKAELVVLEKEAKTLTQLIQKGGSLVKHENEPNKISFELKINQEEAAPTIKDIKSEANDNNQFVFKVGQSGPDVKKLHILLNNLNKDNVNFTPFKPDNDKYDERTARLVAEFQQKGTPPLIGQDKVVLGVVDKKTLIELEKTTESSVKNESVYINQTEKVAVTDDKTAKMDATRAKIISQLKDKGMSDDEIENAFGISKALLDENQMVITETEAKTGKISTGYCYSGVKESMQRELHMEYVSDMSAKNADTKIFRGAYKDIFTEVKLTQDEIMNLPPDLAVIVVHEGGPNGHIGVYGSKETAPGSGQYEAVQASDKNRDKFSYPDKKYSVFIPTGVIASDDKRYVAPEEAYGDNSLAGNVQRKANKGSIRLSQSQIRERKAELEGYNPYIRK